MTIKRILLAVSALVCVASGFIGARQIDRVRHERRVTAIEDQYKRGLVDATAGPSRWPA